MRPECSREQGNGWERNENGAGAHPSLRLALREECARRLHGAAALGTADQGPRRSPGEINGIGRLRSNTFTTLAGCYAQTYGESICHERFGNRCPPLLKMRRLLRGMCVDYH